MNPIRSEIFKLVDLLNIRIRKNISGNKLSGENFYSHGRGMDFKDVREYSLGDDVRFIDWNVTSRMGEIHIKEFYQEKDLPVVIILDCSGSMTSSFPKKSISLQVLALFAFIHIQSGNKVEISVYSDSVDYRTQPIHNTVNLWKSISKLEEFMSEDPTSQGSKKSPPKKTNHNMVIKYLQNQVTRKSLVYWISDFAGFSVPNSSERIFSHHEVHGICINHNTLDNLPNTLADCLFYQSSEEILLSPSPINSQLEDWNCAKRSFNNHFHFINPDKDIIRQILSSFRGGI